MNILILSSGRRVELVNLFSKTLTEMKVNGKIICADSSNLAPALYYSDKAILIPNIFDKNYIDTIIKVCNDEKIAIVIPTIDTELLILSQNREKIELHTKAKVLISNIEDVKICRDKIVFGTYLKNHGFNTPYIYSSEEIANNSVVFPAFIKPKSGSSSIGAFSINNKEQLSAYINIIPDFMIQEYISGDEYTVDAFLDFSSKVITVVPRLRLSTRSGEISKGKIVKDKHIISEVKRLLNTFNFIGHVTIQLKLDKGTISFIEINPRFGGGAPMSIEAGANSCSNIVKILNNEELEYNENYTDGLIFLRYDQSIFIK
jgi:carbamoyl-phosphate synthase large subunit